MPSFCIVFGTSEGQTERVAERIAEVVADRGHEVSTWNATSPPSHSDLADCDGIIIGSSVHVGEHHTAVTQFVMDHLDEVNTTPSAFFQVSLSSASETGSAQAAGYVESLLQTTGWNPDRIGMFGGALRYSEYGFLKRLMMKQIVKRNLDELPEPDTHGDIELTEWDEVEAFANDVAAFVEQRLGVTPQPGSP